MKVLLAHNYYQSSAPSGEDVVYKSELELLKSKHIKVTEYTKSNDNVNGNIDRIKTSILAKWSKQSYDEISHIIRKERPDIVHFHNIWYLISPSAYFACQNLNIPVVQTLHNFRLFCINGLLMNNGAVCEKCITGSPYRGALKRCYRKSLFYSLPMASILYTHQSNKTWDNQIDAFISLSDFNRNKFIQFGLTPEKVFRKPNFYFNPPDPSYSHNGYAIFVGRLSVEKGIDILLNACNNIKNLNDNKKIFIKIVGDGPQNINLKKRINNERIDSIELIGRKINFETIKIIKKAKFIIMPSLWYEGFPMVLGEAYACGKPVIASRLGAMAELVEDGKTGLLFEPGNAKDLADKMRWMYEHEDECIQMGKNARKVFEEKYTADKNFEILMNIYKTVIERHKLKNIKSKSSYFTISQKWNNGSFLSQYKKRLQDVSFLPLTKYEAVQGVESILKEKKGDYFCLSNIHVVMESHRDPELKIVLNGAAGVFADGMGTAGALKYLGYMFKDRVRGMDLMLGLCKYAAENGLKIFLYGNTNETLKRLSEVLKTRYPQLNIAGMYSPPFKELNREEDDEIVKMINHADPDILFVSLGAPKQEKWMAAHKGGIKAVQLGVGAAFDFIAGNLSQAPKWMQHHYLEWLYRLPQQPRKTIYRMSLLPEFLIRLFIQKFWR